MLIGKISDKVTTKEFGFVAEARIKKLDYVTVKDGEGRWILGYIDNIVRYNTKTVAQVQIIGFRDSRSFLKTPNTPLAPDTPIYAAEEDFIKKTLGLEEEGLYIGLLEGYDIKVSLPVKHLVKKHLAVLAKTGAGKSYTTGVLLEELAEQGTPVVVIDPHGEYETLVEKNDSEKDLKFKERFGLEPKSYRKDVQLFGFNRARPVKLDAKLSAAEINHLLPLKLSPAQTSILYTVIKDIGDDYYSLKDVLDKVEDSNSQARWGLISALEMLQDTKLFSANPTKPEDLVKEGKLSIIDLKEADPHTQQILVYKLLEMLFDARKRGKIPQFFLVIEESHTFCPERGFGKTVCSGIIRTIAAEGRKFGFGLGVVTQRPARIEKSVLSQCNTQIILKVTNPNDLKAIVDSVEGVTPGLKEEIKDLPIGVAIVVGSTEKPLLIDIRIRRSMHGGELLRPVSTIEEERTLSFKPIFSKEDIKKEFKGIEDIRLLDYPIWFLSGKSQGKEIRLFVDGVNGEILFKKDRWVERTRGLKQLLDLEHTERKIMYHIISNKTTAPEEISNSLKISLNAVQNVVDKLAKNGYIVFDGQRFRNKLDVDISASLIDIGGIGDPEQSKLSGIQVEFVIPEAFVKKIAELLDIETLKILPACYPYWLIKRKTHKALIDGLSKRMDLEATKGIEKIIR